MNRLTEFIFDVLTIIGALFVLMVITSLAIQAGMAVVD